MVHKHLKTPNGHFIKWQNHLYKILLHKPFLDQVIILCGEEMILIRKNSIGFTKYVFKPYNLVFRVREYISKTFLKGFLPKPFLIIKPYIYLTRNGLHPRFILLLHQIHFWNHNLFPMVSRFKKNHFPKILSPKSFLNNFCILNKHTQVSAKTINLTEAFY